MGRGSVAAAFVLVMQQSSCNTSTARAPSPTATASTSPTTQSATAPSAKTARRSPQPLTDDFRGTVTNTSVRGSRLVTLVDVRTGRQQHYDRTVFEFQGGLPGYHIEYIDEPVRQCGSGEPVPLLGDGWLQVRMTPAHAHTEQGEPTLKSANLEPRHPLLLELTQTCDFEANVTWVLAVKSPERYRVLELNQPPRLVVDVHH